MWYNTLLLGLEQKACEWWVLGWEKDRKKETLTQKKKKKKSQQMLALVLQEEGVSCISKILISGCQ